MQNKLSDTLNKITLKANIRRSNAIHERLLHNIEIDKYAINVLNCFLDSQNKWLNAFAFFFVDIPSGRQVPVPSCQQI